MATELTHPTARRGATIPSRHGAPRIPTPFPLRWLTALTLLAAGAVHLPVIPEHLDEAPYIGYLFIALTVATFALAVAVPATDDDLAWLASGVVCALAVVAYTLTRLVAFPQIGDDVGNWLEPLGVAALVVETATVVLSVLALHRRR